MSNKFKSWLLWKVKEVIKFQYYNKQNKIFLFKCYWYNTTDRGIKVDLYHDLVKINVKGKLHNVDNIFVFSKQCQVYYTYTPFFRKTRSRVNWLSIMKTKLRVVSKLFRMVTMK